MNFGLKFAKMPVSKKQKPLEITQNSFVFASNDQILLIIHRVIHILSTIGVKNVDNFFCFS